MATTIAVGGELIGVGGATTPLLESISSPTGTTVMDPKSNDMAALAGILQPTIDMLEDTGINKIVLVSHLQQITLEESLIPLLSGVDISIAGGSDTLLANSDDRLRGGDVAADQYPVITTDLDGNPAVVVSTDGEYSYVGRLVVNFNAAGILVDDMDNAIDDLSDLNLDLNGPIVTDDQAVADLWGTKEAAFAEGTKGSDVQKLVDAVQDIVIAKDSSIIGETEVYIDGRRESVRTEETNLGDLSADANLAEAQKYDPTVVVSIKNGGGIRDSIGEIYNVSYDFLPPQENPLSGKLDDQISQLDIENALRFNNKLSLLTLTAEGLKDVIEHGVAARTARSAL